MLIKDMLFGAALLLGALTVSCGGDSSSKDKGEKAAVKKTEVDKDKGAGQGEQPQGQKAGTPQPQDAQPKPKPQASPQTGATPPADKGTGHGEQSQGQKTGKDASPKPGGPQPQDAQPTPQPQASPQTGATPPADQTQKPATQTPVSQLDVKIVNLNPSTLVVNKLEMTITNLKNNVSATADLTSLNQLKPLTYSINELVFTDNKLDLVTAPGGKAKYKVDITYDVQVPGSSSKGTATNTVDVTFKDDLDMPYPPQFTIGFAKNKSGSLKVVTGSGLLSDSDIKSKL